MKIKKNILRRYTALKELINTHAIEDQQTLIQLMKQQYGIETSQAIISRDLRTLGISKQKVGNHMIYEMPAHDASKEILRFAVLSAQHNETTIIINTLPGIASFVGDYLDMLQDTDIMGVLAGENVVFVAPKSIHSIDTLFKKICTLMYIKDSSYKKGSKNE